MTRRLAMTDRNQEPKRFSDHDTRQRARNMRNSQWRVMEMAAEHDPVWFSPWNKDQLDEQADEARFDLVGGLSFLDWTERHAEWFEIGDWDEGRSAMPIRLTADGRAALVNRDDYDSEPVFGGLVEPGWQAVPLPNTARISP